MVNKKTGIAVKGANCGPYLDITKPRHGGDDNCVLYRFYLWTSHVHLHKGKDEKYDMNCLCECECELGDYIEGMEIAFDHIVNRLRKSEIDLL